MLQDDAYTSLIDAASTKFIRKYYLNQIIRGSLYTLGLVGIAFLAVALARGYLLFVIGGRAQNPLLRLCLAHGRGASLLWIAIPALRYFRLGRVISARAGRQYHWRPLS